VSGLLAAAESYRLQAASYTWSVRPAQRREKFSVHFQMTLMGYQAPIERFEMRNAMPHSRHSILR
jgi:hypothetical protein